MSVINIIVHVFYGYASLPDDAWVEVVLDEWWCVLAKISVLWMVVISKDTSPMDGGY